MRNRSSQVIASCIAHRKGISCIHLDLSLLAVSDELPKHGNANVFSCLNQVPFYHFWSKLAGHYMEQACIEAVCIWLVWSGYRWRTFIFASQPSSLACNGRLCSKSLVMPPVLGCAHQWDRWLRIQRKEAADKVIFTTQNIKCTLLSKAFFLHWTSTRWERWKGTSFCFSQSTLGASEVRF